MKKTPKKEPILLKVPNGTEYPDVKLMMITPQDKINLDKSVYIEGYDTFDISALLFPKECDRDVMSKLSMPIEEYRGFKKLKNNRLLFNTVYRKTFNVSKQIEEYQVMTLTPDIQLLRDNRSLSICNRDIVADGNRPILGNEKFFIGYSILFAENLDNVTRLRAFEIEDYQVATLFFHQLMLYWQKFNKHPNAVRFTPKVRDEYLFTREQFKFQ